MISKLKFLTSHYDRIIDYDGQSILYVQKEVIEDKRTVYAIDLVSNRMAQYTMDAESDPLDPDDVEVIRVVPAPANDKEIYIANNVGAENDVQVNITTTGNVSKSISIDAKTGQDYTEDILQYIIRDGKTPINNQVKIVMITKPAPSGVSFDPVTKILKLNATTKPGENSIEFSIVDAVQGFSRVTFKITYMVTILK